MSVNCKYDMSDIINAVCVDVDEIYCVDIETGAATSFRQKKEALVQENVGSSQLLYDEIVESYIREQVHPADRKDMQYNVDLKRVCKRLKENPYINIYFRVVNKDRTLYFQMQCIRMGNPDDFKTVLFLLMPDEVEQGQMNEVLAVSTDETTTALTKAVFFHRAREIIEDYPERHFDFVLTDIENFRLVNGIYGEDKGNEVLRYLAESYSNIESVKLCGRYSGDQFVLLAEMEDEPFYGKKSMVLETIRENAPVPYLTLKYGVLRDLDKNDTVSAMCDKVILALKGNMHNYEKSVSTYNEQIIKKHFQDQMYESGFERAISNKEFVVWVQPKFDSLTQRIKGGEALVRWKNTDGTFTSPGDFIPLFESNGLIVRLDEYVFENVCRHQRELIDFGVKPLPVSVNMSRTTLFHPGTVARYKEIIDRYLLPIELVPIELTESAAIDSSQITELIMEIKDAGFKLHMDDFGTGYSSLSSLSMLPFDAVKLDKELIDDIGNDGGDEILRHIIEMAHFFKMEVVGEGVESQRQLKFLEKLGCDTIQGFYFSRPVPYEEFTKMVIKDVEFERDEVEDQGEDAIGSLRVTNEAKMQYLIAISSIYMTLHVADLINNTVTEFATTTNVKEHVNKVHDAVTQMEMAMRGTVSPEYIDEVLEFTDLRTLPARMKGKRTISDEFVGMHFGWFRARFITVTTNEKEEPTKVIFTTQVIEADKRKEEMLLRACRTDELTGVMNRRAFDEDIKTIADSEESKPGSDTDLAVMMVDVNGLKVTNDNLGHAAGDELLRGTTQCIVDSIGKRGTVYRIGGDEFAAIFYANLEELGHLENAYRNKMNGWMGNSVRELSTAWGIVTRKEFPEATIEELIDMADRKMYDNKAEYYDNRK